MTETQRKWLLKYIDKEWLHTDFTTAQDKQDLLEAVIEKDEFHFSHVNTFGNFLFHSVWTKKLESGEHIKEDFVSWLIQLSPEETAELICKWKGVE